MFKRVPSARAKGFVMLIFFWIEVFLFNGWDKLYQLPIQFICCI